MTSKTWTKQLVLAEAAAWIWAPPSATVYRSTGVELVHYANDGGFDPRAYVQDSERPAGDLIAEVEQVISGWGLPDCYWQVFDTARPANFEDELRRRGAKVVEGPRRPSSGTGRTAAPRHPTRRQPGADDGADR